MEDIRIDLIQNKLKEIRSAIRYIEIIIEQSEEFKNDNKQDN